MTVVLLCIIPFSQRTLLVRQHKCPHLTCRKTEVEPHLRNGPSSSYLGKARSRHQKTQPSPVARGTEQMTGGVYVGIEGQMLSRTPNPGERHAHKRPQDAVSLLHLSARTKNIPRDLESLEEKEIDNIPAFGCEKKP